MSIRGISLKGAIATATAAILFPLSLLSAGAQAQQAQLAVDIQPGDDQRIGWIVDENNVVELNGKFILSGFNNKQRAGYELYEFDPATGTNRLLKDILPGDNSSQPSGLSVIDGMVYFGALESSSGFNPAKIYRYNPSTDTTEPVPLAQGTTLEFEFINGGTAFDGRFFINGTSQGMPITAVYDPAEQSLTAIDLGENVATRYFFHYDNKLWLYSQTGFSGDLQVLQIAANSSTAAPFTINQQAVTMVSANGFVEPAVVGDSLFFSGREVDFGDELFKLNLTTGALSAYDVWSGSTGSSPRVLFGYQDTLYFSANNSENGRENLFVLGPNDGAAQAIDVTFFSFANYRAFVGFGDHVYFRAYTDGTGSEPYRIHTGTRETEFLGDLAAGAAGSNPSASVVYNQQLYTHLYTTERGGNYHSWNETNSSYELVGEGALSPASGFPSLLHAFGDSLYFNAVTTDYLTELHRYTASTGALTQITNVGNSEPILSGSLTAPIGVGEKVFYGVVYPSLDTYEYYAYNISTATTLKVKEGSGFWFNPMGDPVELAGKVYFSTSTFGGDNSVLAVYDPSDDSITEVSVAAGGLDPTNVFNLKVFNNRVFFAGTTTSTGNELFSYDPQSDSIEAIEFATGAAASFAQVAGVSGSKLYINVAVADVTEDPSKLYALDTSGQVVQLLGGPQQVGLVAELAGQVVNHSFGSSLQFYDLETGQLTTWETSNPEANEQGIFFSEQFVPVGNDLLVRGNSLAYGQREWFKVDPVAKTAAVFAELNAGPLGSDVNWSAVYNGSLHYSGFRPDVGSEIFKLVTNQAPTISGTPATTIAQGDTYTFTPTGSDADNDPFSYVIENKPSWASFSETTGVLTGTPGNSDVGTYSAISIGITDGKVTTKLDPFSITVTNVNDAPTISGAPSTLTVLQDQVWSFTPTIADIDVGDALLVSLNASAPAWLSVNGSTISGTPGNSDVGITPEIVVTVTDVAGASASLPGFSITVQNVNDAPTISGTPLLQIAQDQQYSFTAVGADVDVGDSLEYTVTGEPAWLTVNDNVLIGTPSNDDVGVHGPINIKVTDIAGAEAALPPFTITVTNVNDAPTISGTPLTTATSGQLYSFSVQAADIDKDDVVTLRLDGSPNWLSITQAGVVSGTPTEADVGLVTGISVVATDQNQAEARLGPFQIDVKSGNNPPKIFPPSVPSATQGELYTVSFEASDEAASSLTWDFFDLPSWLTGTQKVGRIGTISGTPDQAAAAEGRFDIIVRVTDEAGLTDNVVIVVNVIDVNLPPVWTIEAPRDATQDQNFSLTLTASDDDNDTVVFSAPSLPGWLTLQGNVLSGTPRNADVGPVTPFTVTADDQNGGVTNLSIDELVVANVNDAPTISGTPPATAKVGIEYRFAPDFEDIDIGVPFVDEALNFTIANAPNWLTINPGNGSLSGIPTEVGEHRGIVVTVTDKGGLSDSLPAFDITVGLANQAPVAVDDEFSVFFGLFWMQERIDVLANDRDPDDDQLSIVGATKISGPGIILVIDDQGQPGGRGTKILVSLNDISYRGEIEIEYTITDPSGLSDTAIATVIVNGGTPPVITLTPPADLTVKAKGALTLISSADLGTATATDQNNKTVPVSVSGLEAKGYAPGLHTVIWSAGSGDSAVSKAQKIRVIPQVSLEKDLEFAVGDEVKVPVLLSGPAPEYPYSVTLLYSGGSQGLVEIPVTFESGTETSGTLPALTDAPETRTVAIKLDEEGVNAGDKVYIQVSSPAPEQFTQSQEFVDVPFTSVPNQGSMVISVKVVGGKNNSAGAQIAFRLFNPGGIRKFTALRTLNDQGEASARVQFGGWRGDWTLQVSGTRGPEGFVNFKAERTIRVRANGGAPSSDDSLLSQFEYNPSDDDLSRELDQNGNGFVDYQDGRWDYDGNGISAYLDRSLSRSNIWTGSAYAQTTLGQSINTAVENSDDPDSIRMAQTPVREESPEDPIFDGDFTIEKDRAALQSVIQAGMDISNYRFFGEFYAFRVQQLLSAGATAQVALPLDEPLAAGSEFLLWQDDAWRLFEVGAGGALYSASSVFGACPAVDSSAWQLGLNEGHWCVRLDIVDGGVNDSDGEADTTVQVFGGAAIDAAGNTPPVAVADTAVAVWRGSVALLPLANDTDADGNSLSIISASVDIGTVTVNAARTGIQYVSPGDFAGTATITYVVSDNNGGMAVGTATVTVLENRMPVLGADSAVTVSGRPVSVNVLANDADPDGDVLSLTGVSASSGSVSYSGSTVTFTPAASFVGVATVSYSVSDGRGGEATGTLTVQVRQPVEVIEVRPASGTFWWFITLGGLLLAFRRRTHR